MIRLGNVDMSYCEEDARRYDDLRVTRYVYEAGRRRARERGVVDWVKRG